MKTKICSNPKCKHPEKPLTEFYKTKNGKFGVDSWCKKCQIEYSKNFNKRNKKNIAKYSKDYRDKNKEKLNQRSRQFFYDNKEKMVKQATKNRLKNLEHYKKVDKIRREKNKKKNHKQNKEWREKNKKRTNKRLKNRYHNDINFKIVKNLRTRIWSVLKGINKSKKTLELLGCSVEELKIHLEAQFEPGMTWDNHGKGSGKWNMDHIKPCAFFDMTNSKQQELCFHYSNLQPLWAEENIKKSDKLNYEREFKTN